MIIDCHTHINYYDDENSPALPTTLEALQREMRRNRIDMALVLTSYKVNPGRPSIRDVVLATRDLKDIYAVAGVSYAKCRRETLVELREYLQEGTVRGLKLYPGYEPFFPNDPALRPVYEMAAEFDVPVMIHSGDTFDARGRVKYAHPIHIDDVAVDFPEVKIVICHIGNPWIRDCMEVVYKNSNVYTDISGLTLGNFTDRFESYMCKQLQDMLLYGVEPDKVLYGSDWPIATMESYLQFIADLRIPEKDRNKIMYQNAARLFKLSIGNSSLDTGPVFKWFGGAKGE